MKKLVIIDGKSVFYRGYYAMNNLSTADGTPTGGVYGFVMLAFEVIRKLHPDYVVVAWDKKGTSTARRTVIYPEYKAGRKKPPEDFFAQIPILMDLLKALNWPLFECDGYEADDILGTLSEQANKQGIMSCLITSDLDMLQLIDHDTEVYAMKRGFSDIEKFDLVSFEEKYGLKQSQFLDLKSLQGDSSDNIPGVPGIGAKTATSLLQEFGTLDNIYENLDKIKPAWQKKLENGKDLAFMSRELAKIWCDAPVELDYDSADVSKLDFEAFINKLKELEFHSLVRKIPAEMRSLAGAESNQAQTGLFENFNNKEKLEEPKKISAEEFFENGQTDIFIDIDEENEEIIISNGEKLAELNLNQAQKFWPEILTAKTIWFDAKRQFHLLDKFNFSVDFNEIYDIEQMAFLLNALIRDKSLTSISGEDFNETSSSQRIAAMKIAYKNQQVELKNQPKINEISRKLDFPLVKVLFRMEKIGVKIDPEFFAKTSEFFAETIQEIEKDIYDFVGHKFNIASPQQLSKVLFEDLGLPTKGIKKSKTGYSTGQKELDKLRGLHPIIEKIEEFREYSKLKNTYVDALPKLADDNGRIHSTFNQDVTTTGRLSSTNPNLQNIPIRTELGRKIREGFIAEKKNVLVSADYSQFELRLAAVLSNDEPLIEAFNSGVDIHNKTASEIYNIPIEDVKKGHRRAAKIVNFSVLYGAGAHNLAQQIGVDFYEAKRYIDEYFAAHKPIRDFLDKTLIQASEEGFVETFYGRKRPTPDVNSKNFMVREMAKRAAANMPIQGTEADLMKRAMLAVDEKITQSGLGEQILQIHDSIMIETSKENAEKVTQALKQEMENIAPELPIKLKVDVSAGENWLKL